MNYYLKILVLLAVAAAAVYFIPRKTVEPAPNDQSEEPIEAEVIVDTPQPGDMVASPLEVKGRAKGFWFFEANLPVTLKDQNGNVLVQKGFQAQGDWMTENYVEFDDVLTFPTPT